MSSPVDEVAVVPGRTALVLIDFEQMVVNQIPNADAVIERVVAVRAAAQRAGLLTIHVRVAFRPGHPEVSESNSMFKGVKDYALMLDGSADSAFDARLQPGPDEITIIKTRVGAFQSTPLEQILRAQGAELLLVAGINTSGTVLSTVRDGADRDFELAVIADCCADPDESLHAVLIEKVLSQQARLVSSTSLIETLAG